MWRLCFIFAFFETFLAKEPRKLSPEVLRWRYGIPESNVPVHFHLAFAGPTGMAITWETDSDTSTHLCLYGTDKSSLNLNQTGSSRTYGTIYSHNVILKNLKTSTRYYYSCGDSSAGMSPLNSFVTAPPIGDRSSFAIAVVGDMGIRQSDGVSASMITRQDSYNWVLDVGDLGYADDYYLYFSTYEHVYATFMDDIEPIASTRAFMAVPGNHEATCNEFLPFVCDESYQNFSAYRTRWRMPSEESGGVANMWHSFDFGPIHFVQISTETDFPDAPEGPDSRLPSGPFGDQLTWLANDLEKAYNNRATVPWIIVSGHRPIWYSAGEDNNQPVQDTFLDYLTKYKVDFYLCGHEHNYERYFPITSTGTRCQGNYSNSPCPIYIVNGAGGNVEGHQKGHGNPDYLAYRNATNYGWGRLTLQNASTLLWEFITDNNQIVDSAVISKNV